LRSAPRTATPRIPRAGGGCSRCAGHATGTVGVARCHLRQVASFLSGVSQRMVSI
jgi:hypothetical protein